MRKNKLKIGLDFHGVISKRPDFFSRLSQAACQRGYEVHIITGGPSKIVESFLKEHKIFFNEIFAIYDYYDAQGEVEYFSNGEFKVPDKLWNSAKAEYCTTRGINIHIDDSRQYAKWFTTPFCRYNDKSQNCHLGEGITIDFSKSAEDALNQIDEMIKTTQFF